MSNRAQFVEDDDSDEEQFIEAQILGSQYLDVEMEKLTGGRDPFEEIPRAALDKNSKRRVDRLMKKYSGAGSQTKSDGSLAQTSSDSINPFLSVKNPKTAGGAQAKYITPEQIFN